MLPDIDGYEVCSTLKSRRATNPVPVVMVSARVAADNRQRGLRVGADDYVPKPYTPDQIFRALAAAECRRLALQSHEDRGAFALGEPAEAETETLAAIARLRALLLARTDWEEAEVARLADVLTDLGRDASRHARDRGLDRVAAVRYRRLPDRLTLTLNDEDDWLGPTNQSPLAPLLPLFDRADNDAHGREVVLTKYLEPTPAARS